MKNLRVSISRLRFRTSHLLRALVTRFRDQDYFLDEVLYPSKKRVKQFSDNVEYGQRVLDVGTGSGVLARVALQKGAAKVVAIDINPAAITSARRVAPAAEVFLSDLFSSVSGEFDTITFSAPWSEGEITRDVHRAVFENGVTARFLREAPAHLAPGGAVWLQYCDASTKNFEALKRWIADFDYSVLRTWSYRCHDIYSGSYSNIILYKLMPVRQVPVGGLTSESS